VQILVVVAHIQVEVDRLKAEGWRRVPCQHQMDMGKPILRHGGNLLLNTGFVAMTQALLGSRLLSDGRPGFNGFLSQGGGFSL